MSAVVLVLLAACDPPPPRSAPTPPVAEAAPAAPVTLRAPSLQVTLTALRRNGDSVEIELALDRKLPMTGASRPTLQIGEHTIRRSRRPDGQLDRLVFLLSAAELDALEDGAPLVVRDRGVSSEQMTSPPRLDKSKLVVTP
jgi:hypothetical protein